MSGHTVMMTARVFIGISSSRRPIDGSLLNEDCRVLSRLGKTVNLVLSGSDVKALHVGLVNNAGLRRNLLRSQTYQSVQSLEPYFGGEARQLCRCFFLREKLGTDR